jgi:hypothetical protein
MQNKGSPNLLGEPNCFPLEHFSIYFFKIAHAAKVSFPPADL